MRLTSPLAVALAAAGPAFAAPYTFAPLPAGFTATALNNVGQIAGRVPPSSFGGFPVPALYDRGTIAPLDLPVSSSTTVSGINDAGDFVGFVAFRYTGPFAVFGGVPTPFAVPTGTSSGAGANGLNEARQIVGSGALPDAVPRGYISSGGAYTLLEVPGAAATAATDIDDTGRVVGIFSERESSRQRGFLYNGGTFTAIDRPGADQTLPVAINDAGVIAGTYSEASGVRRGFTLAGGVFADITGPDGAAFLPVDLNDLGQLIGTFGDTGPSHLATPRAVPEPATAALLGGGLLVLGAARLRRRGDPVAIRPEEAAR